MPETGAPGDGAGDTDARRNSYAGEGTVPLSVRMYVPLRERYKKLARELTADGYRTWENDLYAALLHFGPEDVDQATDLLERFRAVRHQYDGEPTRPTAPRVYASIHSRYQQLAWALEDAGVQHASMTELLHALLHFGPADAVDARALARRWRMFLAA